MHLLLDYSSKSPWLDSKKSNISALFSTRFSISGSPDRPRTTSGTCSIPNSENFREHSENFLDYSEKTQPPEITGRFLLSNTDNSLFTCTFIITIYVQSTDSILLLMKFQICDNYILTRINILNGSPK